MNPHGRQIALVGVASGAGLLAAYLRLVRPWTMRWGATNTEVARSLPGDQLMTRPRFKATRAITIAARPEHIWPWLVQLGSGRAGWSAASRRRIRRCGRDACCTPSWPAPATS